MTTTAEVYNETFFKQILASIRELELDFDKNLSLNKNEPNLIQLLKLLLRAFFNSILKCPFIDKSGCYYIKALWHIYNITCAQSIYLQHNYMDLYPYQNDGYNFYLPGFPSCFDKNGDSIHEYHNMMTQLPYLIAATRSLNNIKPFYQKDVLEHLLYLVEDEKSMVDNLQKLAINLMFHVGEYSNNAMDKFVDIMTMGGVGGGGNPDDSEDEDEEDSRILDRALSHRSKLKEAPLSLNKSLCLLAKARDGNRLLTIQSNKDPVIGSET